MFHKVEIRVLTTFVGSWDMRLPMMVSVILKTEKEVSGCRRVSSVLVVYSAARMHSKYESCVTVGVIIGKGYSSRGRKENRGSGGNSPETKTPPT